jgi:cytochrome c oxidase assembly protein subunit 15
MRRWVILGLVLLALQIALGGWTSANYAALACGNDFPQCVGQWWPAHDFREGFVLWRGIGVDYEGGILDGQSRIAIQLAHRTMALVVLVYLLWLALKLLRTPGMRGWGGLLATLALAQVALGIANVKLGLPLKVAVMHNAGRRTAAVRAGVAARAPARAGALNA